MKIVFLGNFNVSYSTENHHVESLKILGHTVVKLQEGMATAEIILQEAVNSDMFVVVHTHGWETPGNISMAEILQTLRLRGIPSVSYHLDLWIGLDREKDLDNDPFYKNIEYFFTVDKLMAEYFNDLTDVKGYYLPAAVYSQEVKYFKRPKFYTNVLFVGSSNYHPEWPYRKELVNWLQDNYGKNFKHIGPGGPYGIVRGVALNRVYSETKISIGDSLCLNFTYPYYWSDRVYETIGRGGFIIHPYIEGMEQHFVDKKHLVYYEYNNFDDLKAKIDYYLDNAAEREKIRLQGFEHVKENHTYLNRWQYILGKVFDD